MNFKTLLIAGACAIAASSMAVSASATVIEDFETGSFGGAWVAATGSLGSVSINAGGAHDGAFGVSDGGSSWIYRTDVVVNDGDTLSAWARPGTGRFYLGFGASSGGASSFVLGGNTSQIIFQNNDGYGFSNVTTQGFGFTEGSWYLTTITFSGGVVTGNVFASDGTTLLASLVASGLDHGTGGGVAVRSFSDFAYDTIGLSSGAVPEPATWALMIGGFGLAGVALRRRRDVSAAA
jgi:hypothetical protein